jgi:hypothetical protein
MICNFASDLQATAINIRAFFVVVFFSSYLISVIPLLGEKAGLLLLDGTGASPQFLGGVKALHHRGDIEDGEVGAAQVLL